MTKCFIQSTNLKAISQFSQLKYTWLYDRLRQSDYFENEEMILLKGPFIKGQQKIKHLNGKVKTNARGIEVIDKNVFSDFFEEIKK